MTYLSYNSEATSNLNMFITTECITRSEVPTIYSVKLGNSIELNC
jgi:hypothetical protein